MDEIKIPPIMVCGDNASIDIFKQLLRNDGVFYETQNKEKS